ncbi:hypothetical protein ACLI4U_12595 [Natrialbaceae archaeon A-CW2]
MKLQREFDRDRRSFTGALFTTYVFNCDYFEGTLLPILRRKSVGSDTIVCLDADAYQATMDMADMRPEYIGGEYYLAPMRLERGRFHPKVFLFGSEDRTVGFVGSANLTATGFDQNQEVVTRFDVQNTEDQTVGPDHHAVWGIRDFFRDLLEHPLADAMGATAKQKAGEILEATNWVAKPAQLPIKDATTAVLHNLETPLLKQIIDRVDDRGEEFQRVDIVAPFFGTGLSVPKIFTDEGIRTTVWLQQNWTQIEQEPLQRWATTTPDAAAAVYEADRYVHGKVIILRTASAVYCLAGSPNASQAALLETPDPDTGYGNLEVAVFRRVPDPDHYEYLLQDVIDSRVDYGIDEFTPKPMSEYRPSERETDTEIDLLSIDFTQSDVFDGGDLSGQVRLPTDDPDSSQFTLQIEPTANKDSVEISISAADLKPADDERRYMFSRRITEDLLIATLSSSAVVTPSWAGTTGMSRWLAIQTQDTDRQAKAAAEDDGVDAVWRTLYTMFLGDNEEQTEQLEFLGKLASEMSTADDHESRDGPEDGETADEEDDGLSEGITLPPHGGTTSTRNPTRQLEGYYETWKEHLRKLRNALLADEADAERILRLAGERLAEINRINTWLEIINRELEARGEDLDEFPDHLPRIYTRILYSESEPGFKGNTSVVAQFVRDATEALDEEYQPHLRTYIGANILFGQLIAQNLLAEDVNTFTNYYGSDFDVLLSQCLPEDTRMTQDGTFVEELTEALWEQFGELPETLKNTSLSRSPPSVFYNKQQTRRFVSFTL